MIYDYEDQEEYVSLWVGRCKDYSVVDNYLSTVYPEEDFDDDTEAAGQNKVWRELFIADNQSRACEEELKDHFNYEFYNQFEYDFGLTFDEDYWEANVLENFTEDFAELFDGFSYCDSFLEELRTIKKPLTGGCNTAVALYDFKYDGGILEAEHEHICLYFLGYLKYNKN